MSCTGARVYMAPLSKTMNGAGADKEDAPRNEKFG
jgi:hypothetical protein